MSMISIPPSKRRYLESALPFLAPLFIVIILCFNLPLLTILNYGLSGRAGYSFENFEEIITTSSILKVALNTVKITLFCTIVVAVLGYILAYWMTTLSATTRNIVLAMVILPFWVSVLVRTYAWIVVLGNAGVINRALQALHITDAPVGFLYNELGVIVGMANIQMPLLVLPLYAAMLRVDQRHLQAAASLGASNRMTFWKVFFPQTLKAYFAGIMLVTIVSLGFYITPAILGGGRVRMLSNVIDTYINFIPRWEIASALSILLLLVTLVLFAVYRKLDSHTGE